MHKRLSFGLALVLAGVVLVPLRVPAAVLVSTNSAWRFLPGLTEASTVPDNKAWRSNTFDDTSWEITPAPFLYTTAGSEPPFWGGGAFNGTWLTNMLGGYTCIFLRKTFVITNLSEINALTLRAMSDDGFIAWINGTEVVRFNMPAGEQPFNGVSSPALSEPVAYASYALTSPPISSYLKLGTNVLAVQGFNSGLSSSSDFGFEGELVSDTLDAVPPGVGVVSPAPGSTLPSLSEITVVFSEPVRGVNASDLLVNGVPASSVRGGGDTYLFSVLAPAEGTVSVTWAAGHGITDLSTPANGFDATGPGATWQYTITDVVAPRVASVIPLSNSTVRALTRIEVRFTEAVTGVDAADLLVNSSPATNLIILGPDQYAFDFPQPATGTVQVAWAAGHGITDVSANSNAFVPGSGFTYVLNPSAGFGDLRINEFLANNDRGRRDEDGDTSDWIELFNASSTATSLEGFYLTDDPGNLTKWRFPAVTIGANGFLLVYASGKDRTNPAAPLHANFALENNGEFLALVGPDGTNVLQAFAPAYPPQYADVSYGSDAQNPEIQGYFTNATPLAVNGFVGLGIGPEVRFSRTSGTFVNGFSLELSVPDTNYVIRYFIVNNSTTAAATNVPNAGSPVYTTPIAISGTTQVRARAFPTRPNYLPGPPRSETYIQIDSGAAAFSSDLPVIIFHNFGGGIPPSSFTSPGAVGVFMVFDTNNPSGRTSLTNPPVLVSRAGAHVRGSSTEGYDKRNLAIETWTEVNFQDNNVEVLGMPADSDWVLYAPNQFDRNYLHNPLAMAMGRQMGHYASRTRFAELFLNTTGGAVTYPGPVAGSSYNGIYVVMEKIKVSNNRLDIARLDAEDTSPETITGGYIMKIDRANDPDDVNNFSPGAWPANVFPWITANHAGWNTQPIIFHDPDGLVIGQRPAQRNWFINYINAFEAALISPNWTNPVTGYAAYIDVDQWIENHMLNILPFNVDGYRLSGYFYKERDEPGRPGSGKLKQGPLWDYDRSQGTGSVDPRPFNPRQWKRPLSGDQGTDLFGNNDNTTGTRLGVRWWWQLFHDIDFWQRWVDRWTELRKTVYATTNVTALIDSLANEVRQAQPRNASRWPSGNSIGTPNTGTHSFDGYSHTFDGTYQGDVNFLKKWWTDRLDFVDTNFLRPPAFSYAGGPISTGFSLTITAPTIEPNSMIYYTLDGTDPRTPGGGVAPNVRSNIGSVVVVLTNNARVFARNWNPNHANLTNQPGAPGGNPPISTPWSGPTIGTFVAYTPALRISEIMYHPAPPPGGNTNDADNFEYLELVNVGASTINLPGFKFTNGIQFTFTATNRITSLAPGGRLLLVKNFAAFASRYPTLTNLVAGEYGGNLANAGERLSLIGPLAEPILDFAYSDEWFADLTDGRGFSLVVVDEAAPTTAWTNVTQWRRSAYDGGSPGSPDAALVSVPPVLITEIMSHPVFPDTDSIELFNPNPVSVDLGGWYLTDNFDRPKKYRIPEGTTIDPYGFLVFYGATSFGTPGASNAFGLSSEGEEVYLFSGDAAGRLTGYFQGFDFGPAAPGVTFGRHLNSLGVTQYVAQSTNTLGASNAPPRVGPVAFTEINYFPPNLTSNGLPVDNFRDEFLELRNLTDDPLPLYDTNRPASTWAIEKGVDYVFPPGVVMPPQGRLLVVSFDPVTDTNSLAAFQIRYGLSNQVPIYGPFSGHLDNSGERIELRRPGTYNPVSGQVPMILVDRVDYSRSNSWPNAGLGYGASLQKRSPFEYGNEPTNWITAAATPGADVQPGEAPVITQQPQPRVVNEGENTFFTVAVTGPGPFTFQWLFNDQIIDGAIDSMLVLTNVTAAQVGAYRVSIMNGGGIVFSDPATLFVRSTPLILPGNITLFPNPNTSTNTTSNVTFTVSAGGLGTLSYQWRWWGTNLPGATGTNLVIPNASLWNAGPYDVIVYDDIGPRQSQPVQLAVAVKPTIYVRPVGQNVLSNGIATLTVLAGPQHPALPLLYFWRRAGLHYAMTLTPTLVMSNVVGVNSMTVVVTNHLGLWANTIPVSVTGLPDSDGDGVPDSLEAALGMSPTNAADGALDYDGDGMSNAEEWASGTSVSNAASVLKIHLPPDNFFDPSRVVFRFDAISNKTYSVEYLDALGAVWNNLISIDSHTTNRTLWITNTLPPGVTSRFYRLKVPLNP